MSNLFKGYLTSEDKYFASYIQHKKGNHDNGENIDTDRLMILALKNYKNLFTKDNWLSKSPEY